MLECGTNTRGEIVRLARIVEPDVAAVLNVDVEHSEGLGSLAEIADEEAALFTTARRAVVACTEERLVMERIPRGAEVVTFGAATEADVRIAARVPAAAGAARSRVTLALSPRLVAAGAPARLDPRWHCSAPRRRAMRRRPWRPPPHCARARLRRTNSPWSLARSKASHRSPGVCRCARSAACW